MSTNGITGLRQSSLVRSGDSGTTKYSTLRKLQTPMFFLCFF